MSDFFTRMGEFGGAPAGGRHLGDRAAHRADRRGSDPAGGGDLDHLEAARPAWQGIARGLPRRRRHGPEKVRRPPGGTSGGAADGGHTLEFFVAHQLVQGHPRGAAHGRAGRARPRGGGGRRRERSLPRPRSDAAAGRRHRHHGRAGHDPRRRLPGRHAKAAHARPRLALATPDRRHGVGDRCQRHSRGDLGARIDLRPCRGLAGDAALRLRGPRQLRRLARRGLQQPQRQRRLCTARAGRRPLLVGRRGQGRSPRTDRHTAAGIGGDAGPGARHRTDIHRRYRVGEPGRRRPARRRRPDRGAHTARHRPGAHNVAGPGRSGPRVLSRRADHGRQRGRLGRSAHDRVHGKPGGLDAVADPGHRSAPRRRPGASRRRHQRSACRILRVLGTVAAGVAGAEPQCAGTARRRVADGLCAATARCGAGPAHAPQSAAERRPGRLARQRAAGRGVAGRLGRTRRRPARGGPAAPAGGRLRGLRKHLAGGVGHRPDADQRAAAAGFGRARRRCLGDACAGELHRHHAALGGVRVRQRTRRGRGTPRGGPQRPLGDAAPRAIRVARGAAGSRSDLADRGRGSSRLRLRTACARASAGAVGRRRDRRPGSEGRSQSNPHRCPQGGRALHPSRGRTAHDPVEHRHAGRRRRGRPSS